MNGLSIPAILDPKQRDLITKEAPHGEKNNRLSKDVLNLLQEQQWPKMLAPSRYGGGEYGLPKALYILEELARADGSLGWMVTRSAISGWFAGFTDAEFSKKIFDEPKVFIAGSSSQELGTAEKTKTGYIINGEWLDAAGVAEATIFTGNCVVTQNKKPLKDENNKNTILSFIFLKKEVTAVSAPETIGLVGAGTYGFKVTNLSVTPDRSFKINNELSKIDAPLYNFPFLQLTEAAMAVNISGMANHFIELYKTSSEKRKEEIGSSIINDHTQLVFEKYTQKLNDARTKLYYAIELSWQASVNSKQIKEAILYKVSAGAFELAKRARECVDALYPYCGIEAAVKDSEISKVWRDLHTASQQSILVYGGFDD